MFGHPVPIAANAGARWHPAVRRIGQAAQAPSVTVMVTRDGAPAPGVPVEVMFQSGNTKTGSTDASGKYVTPAAPADYGQAVIRITPPADVEDLGEGTAQGVAVSAAPSMVNFALVSSPVAAAPASPFIGIALAVALLGVATFGMGGGK